MVPHSARREEESMASIPLYRQIQEDIRVQIASGVLRAGDRISSESEIMRHYFVSSITVKNALGGLADEGVIYRLKGKGSFVSASPFTGGAPGEDGRLVGVVFPTMATRVEQVYLVNIERECRRNDCRVMVGISRESPELEVRQVQEMIKGGVRALILFPTVSEINNALVRQLVAHSFPLVFMDRYLEDIPTPAVVSDNSGGARLAAEYLTERCGNRVMICHFPAYNTAVCARLDGFRQGMADAGYGMPPASQCVIEDGELLCADSGRRVELLYDTLLAHLRRYPEIDGCFAANAEIAQVANLALKSLGRTPGRDFHLVAFDNPHLPGVGFIQQDCRAIVERSVWLLLSQLGGKAETGVHTVPVRLVEVSADPAGLEDMRHLVTGLNP
jgi:DNA-binding LacI/PurR family transcriptional regulator